MNAVLCLTYSMLFKNSVKMEFNSLCNQQQAVQVPVKRCHESAGVLIINVKFKTIITQPAQEEGRTQVDLLTHLCGE